MSSSLRTVVHRHSDTMSEFTVEPRKLFFSLAADDDDDDDFFEMRVSTDDMSLLERCRAQKRPHIQGEQDDHADADRQKYFCDAHKRQCE
jgi:hypothetical protein